MNQEVESACVGDSSTLAEASVHAMRKKIGSDRSSLIALTLALFLYPEPASWRAGGQKLQLVSRGI